MGVIVRFTEEFGALSIHTNIVLGFLTSIGNLVKTFRILLSRLETFLKSTFFTCSVEVTWIGVGFCLIYRLIFTYISI